MLNKKVKSIIKKTFTISFIVLMFVMTIQSALAEQSEYYMLTYAQDKDTDDLIPAQIRVWSYDNTYNDQKLTSEYPLGIEKVYFYNIPVNKLLHAEYSADDFYTDVDDYYFDSRLDTCVASLGDECTLESNGYRTECENYVTDNIPFLYCSVYNNGQSFAFIYDVGWNTVTTGNYMHCVDDDNDGICDKDEPQDCVGENANNIPSDTECRDWFYDANTGCHDYTNDDGTTVCASSLATDYSCVDGTLLGQDVFRREMQRQCGVNTGECDGAVSWTSYTLHDDCTNEEYCIEDYSACVPCADVDQDGVCDNDDQCIGETLSNLPQDTTCEDWSFNYNTGCHESDKDDGSTVCDYNVQTQYACIDGTLLGQDVYSRSADRYCGALTGQCDGILQWSPFAVHDDCSLTEYCVPDNPECQTCVDTDNDGVCDFEDLCVGENLANLPADTTCRDWSFNDNTGCHEFTNDDGTTLCDADLNVYDYSCVDGTALGQDVFTRGYERYCGINTGECDGVPQTKPWTVNDDCDANEYCVEGNPTCQEYVQPTCTGNFAQCFGSGTISGSICYYGAQNNLCVNPPQWSCTNGDYVDCNNYDDDDYSDNYVANLEPGVFSCTSTCSGQSCCSVEEEFECNNANVCTSGNVDNRNYFCFNDGNSYYIDVFNQPPAEYCSDGIDNDCDGLIDENCPGPFQKSIDVSMSPQNPDTDDDIYCNADIVNNELNEVIYYEITGDIQASGNLACNNSCSLSLRIDSQYTSPGDTINCKMSFETYADTDSVNVQSVIPVFNHRKIEQKESRLKFTSIGLLGDEFVYPGDYLDFIMGFRNEGDDLEDVRVRITLMNIWGGAEFRTFGPLELEDGAEDSMITRIHIPDDMEPGLYYARINVGEGDLRRVKHRMFYVL
jgi:hypothetical protein